MCIYSVEHMLSEILSIVDRFQKYLDDDVGFEYIF